MSGVIRGNYILYFFSYSALSVTFFFGACRHAVNFIFFFFQAEDGIRDGTVTGVQTCASSDLVVEEDPGGIPVEAVPQPMGQTGACIFCQIERDPGVIEDPNVVETVMAMVVLAIPQTERMQRGKKSNAANHMIEKARGGVALMAGVMPNNKQGDNQHPAEWNKHKCGEGLGH